MLVGEGGRKTAKHCIIIFVILTLYFEGDEKKKIKEDRVCGTCGRELERKRLFW